uniref:Uncharacterized protein n=1 Tax=Kuenenia stuttgartiensis TaxID=174633 RepID=Q1Q0P8_KUEST|nr:unknown protein [Candidatus Kuenenia stuttgartiensis]
MVSITTLMDTFLLSHFFYGVGNIRFNFIMSISCRFFMYFLDNATKTSLPVIKRNNFYRYLFILFYCNILKRLCILKNEH